MFKKIKLMSLMLFALIIASCGGSDDGPGAQLVPNSAPTVVGELTYPSSDLLCIDSTIDFQWSASTDPNGDAISYELTVALDRNLTSIVEQVVSTTNSKTLTLQKGTAYYWNVVAKDTQDEAEPSATFAFYTEGEGASNYAPFTAALNAPELETFLDAGTTTLDWSGSDVNADDTLTYDLYFSDADPAVLLQADVTASTFDVTTVAATTYYWRVDTKDDSGVKSIGQVWTFSTN